VGRLVFLSLWLRLAASPFAIVFLLVLANPFYVALSPDASVHATVADSTRFRNFSVKEPTLQRHFVNSKHPSYLRRRKVLHYAITNSIFRLTCQVLRERIFLPEVKAWTRKQRNTSKK
jgi:hypothetical protein